MAQVTLDDVIAQYLAALSTRSRASYKSTISKWLSWCDLNGINPLEAQPAHIEVYASYLHNQLGQSRSRQASTVSILCNLYKRAYMAGLTEHDPSPYVTRPRVRKHSEGTYLDREQACRLLATAQASPDPRMHALVCLLMLSGCRLHEALELKIEDYHRDSPSWVTFDRKNQWQQQVTISSTTSEALDRLIGDRVKGLIFREGRKALNGNKARRLFHQLCRDAGLREDITPHSLRRTFATLCRDAGVNDQDIIAAGGWMDTQMLDYYDMHRKARTGNATNTLSDYLAP